MRDICDRCGKYQPLYRLTITMKFQWVCKKVCHDRT